VVGTVVDFLTDRPLAGRIVQLGATRATTNADGMFTIAVAPSTYDIAVLEPDGTSVSLYYRLTRRDPLLSHESSSANRPLANTATIGGTVSGGAPFPLVPPNGVTIYYFSSATNTSLILGGSVQTPLAGPQFGPLQLSWNGDASTSGELVALGTFPGAADTSAWLASEAVTLFNGQDAQAEVSLSPTSAVVLGGNITPKGIDVSDKEVLYRLPFVDSTMNLVFDETADASFSYSIPNLSSLGGQYCVAVHADMGFAGTQLCGIGAGTMDASVSVAEPPSMQEPAGATFVADGGFAWTAVENSVYMLQFKQMIATAETPNIDVFTVLTSVPWPNLAPLGIAVPAGATYECTIGALGPYNSMDDAFGPTGQGQPFPTVLQAGYSRPKEVTLSP